MDALLWPDGGGLTVAEVAAAAGMPEATARRARRLIGLADPGDEPVCHRGEIELLVAIRIAIEMFGEEPALEFTRVLGTSTAAMAEAAISMFAVSVAEPLRDAGASPIEYAQRVRESTVTFTAARSAIDIMMRLQFDEAVDRLTGHWDDGERLPRDEVEFTIGFIDLVESTRLTVESDTGEFAAAVRDFEGLAAEAAARHSARLVKLIGDGAMIAAPVAEPVAMATQDLVATVSARRTLPRRPRRHRVGAGLRAQRRLPRRTGEPRVAPQRGRAPGEILCDAMTAAALPERTKPAGERTLRGFDGPQPVYVLAPAPS